ncbi:hypothetical protein [Nonomuraea sp. NPDC049309]|uniref:hypothetical protein n=1 Tax=Nonomuraea sp. NPDC049309 TaxID=3364350 RepID=UPI003720847E
MAGQRLLAAESNRRDAHCGGPGDDAYAVSDLPAFQRASPNTAALREGEGPAAST